MKTSVTELGDSRVRVEVDVPAEDVDRQLGRAARAIAREMRMPGFRKGKAPPALVIQRVGRGPVVEQAVRDALPEWYERALLDSGISPVGDPSIEVVDVPESEGEPLAFRFEVGVRPGAELGDYLGLEAGRPDAEVPDDIVERELEGLRERSGRLDPVERPAAAGEFIQIDFRGSVDGEPFEGGEARDYLLELGSGQLIEGFEEQLIGAEQGEQREVRVTFPEDYGAENLAGKEVVFETTVKEVREKVLPALDDGFASEASEFDTLDELRADIRSKLSEAVEQRIESDFRLAAVDVAAANATVELPAEIIASRAEERWERVERQLTSRGMNPVAYLQMQGKTREQVIEETKPDAERELRREAVLTAVADAEQIDVSDEELIEALEQTAEHERTSPEKLLERLRANGRDALIREDIRIRKAVDLIAAAAKPIPIGQAEAREKLWTPASERESGPGALWTPGDV